MKPIREALEWVGRHPVATTWLGLQCDLFLYWRLAAPFRFFARLSHELGVAGAMGFLNTPGIQLVSPFLPVFDAVAPKLSRRTNAFDPGDVAFLLVWVVSAVMTYAFWNVLRRIGMRWLNARGGVAFLVPR